MIWREGMMQVFCMLTNGRRISVTRSLLTGAVFLIASQLCASQTPVAPSGSSEALFPLCRAAKMCGYIDQTGKVVVSQIYVYASVITLKPAIRYQFKTGQRNWPKT
jgi:hypothetical protein